MLHIGSGLRHNIHHGNTNKQNMKEKENTKEEIYYKITVKISNIVFKCRLIV